MYRMCLVIGLCFPFLAACMCFAEFQELSEKVER